MEWQYCNKNVGRRVLSAILEKGYICSTFQEVIWPSLLRGFSVSKAFYATYLLCLENIWLQVIQNSFKMRTLYFFYVKSTWAVRSWLDGSTVIRDPGPSSFAVLLWTCDFCLIFWTIQYWRNSRDGHVPARERT